MNSFIWSLMTFMSFHQPGKPVQNRKIPESAPGESLAQVTYGQVNLIGGEISVIISAGQLFPLIPEPKSLRACWGHVPYFKLFTTTSLRFVRFEETNSKCCFFCFSQQVETHPGVYILTTTKWLGAVLKTVKQKMEDSNSEAPGCPVNV